MAMVNDDEETTMTTTVESVRELVARRDEAQRRYAERHAEIEAEADQRLRALRTELGLDEVSAEVEQAIDDLLDGPDLDSDHSGRLDLEVNATVPSEPMAHDWEALGELHDTVVIAVRPVERYDDWLYYTIEHHHKGPAGTWFATLDNQELRTETEDRLHAPGTLREKVAACLDSVEEAYSAQDNPWWC